MKKCMLKKGLLLGIIFILILVVIPIASGELRIYPQEDGPYTVFIGGKCYGGSLPIITWNPFKYRGYGIHIGPFCNYNYPWGPAYNWENGTIFIVNDEIEILNYTNHQIGLYGLKGFCPAYGQWFFKFIFGGRIRVFGICEEIYFWYTPSNN